MASFRHLPMVCVALLLAGSSQAASGANMLSLPAVIDAAWQRSPEARTLIAKRNEVRAERQLAQSWVSGTPSVGISERNDRLTSHDGIRETELSLSSPVWLPGQRTARQALADSGQEDLEAQIARSRLSIAGTVREHLWAVAAAREAVEEARDHQSHLQELAEEVERRVMAGDLARTDGMLARQEMLAAQGAISAAQARLNEAMSRFTLLTGHAQIPAFSEEKVATGIADPHPRLLAAQVALRHAESSLYAINAMRRGTPTVGLSVRRERDGSSPGRTDTIGVAVQIPFGTAVRNAPQEAAALTLVETARAELVQIENAIRAEIELAQLQLQQAQQAMEAATARSRIAAEHLQLIEKAFRLGERGLAEVIRARALAHEAEAAERQQRVGMHLTAARLNQAKGILP